MAPATVVVVYSGHALQVAAPGPLNLPGVQSTAVPFADPGGHAYPAAQVPTHAAVALNAPATLPYRPLGHMPLHDVCELLLLNLPGAHGVHGASPPALLPHCPLGHMLFMCQAIVLVLEAAERASTLPSPFTSAANNGFSTPVTAKGDHAGGDPP